MLISTSEGVQRIEHKLKTEMQMPRRHKLTVMREYRKELQFNLITEKKTKCDLRQKDVRIILYFVTKDKGTVSSSLKSMKQTIDNPAIKSLLQEFSDVLREDLSEGLSPERDLDHAIETDIEHSSNRNIFLLSEQQLRE